MSRSSLPPIIRRNLAILLVAQIFTGIGFQFIPLLGGLMAVALTGSIALAGTATTVSGLGNLLAAYPAGRLMDRAGRRKGLGAGALLATFGAVGTALSFWVGSFLLFVLALLVFGLGFGALRQMHIAAADLFPPHRRGEGIGFLTMGGIAGSFIASAIVAATRPFSGGEASHYTMLWLIAAAILMGVLGLLTLVRPDPIEVARDLHRFYPLTDWEGTTATGTNQGGRSPRELLGLPTVQIALLVSAVVHGNMVMAMALAPVVMRGHGHSLDAVSLAVAIHVLGMYGLAAPIGRFGDRYGRAQLLAYGLVISAASMALIPFSTNYLLSALGLFGVGLGWSCGAISTAALLSDLAGATHRGGALGIHEISMRLAGLLFPLGGGWLSGAFGYPAIGYVGATVGLLPLLLLAWMRRPLARTQTS